MAERTSGGGAALGRSVGVAVIAANRHQHLERTVASLGCQTRPPDRVVVVDLGSSPPLRDALGGRPEIEVVELDRRGGGPWPLARARNAAAAALGTEVQVFLDVDCMAAPDLVAAYEQAAEAAPCALLCGPVRYLRRGWSDDVADRQLGPVELGERSDRHPVRPELAPDHLVVAEDHERFWSLAFGVAASVWSDLGGFDEAYVGYGGEDTDFALRARAAGVSLAWFGGGTAFHQWHPATRHDPERVPEIVANARRFRARWGTWPMAGWLVELHDAGLVRFDPGADTLGLVGPVPSAVGVPG